MTNMIKTKMARMMKMLAILTKVATTHSDCEAPPPTSQDPHHHLIGLAGNHHYPHHIIILLITSVGLRGTTANLTTGRLVLASDVTTW